MGPEIEFLYVVQLFAEDAWRSLYVTSYLLEAEEAFEEVLSELDDLEWGTAARLAAFTVSGVDFIATHATDFARLSEASHYP